MSRWLATAEEVLASDARDYRNWLLDQGWAPATVNRAMTSLSLFLEALGRQRGANPFRKVDLVEIVEQAPRALTRNEWNAVRREAEKHRSTRATPSADLARIMGESEEEWLA